MQHMISFFTFSLVKMIEYSRETFACTAVLDTCSFCKQNITALSEKSDFEPQACLKSCARNRQGRMNNTIENFFEAWNFTTLIQLANHLCGLSSNMHLATSENRESTNCKGAKLVTLLPHIAYCMNY